MKLAQHKLNPSLFFILVFESDKKGIQVRQFTFTTYWETFCSKLSFNQDANNWKMIWAYKKDIVSWRNISIDSQYFI